MKAFIVGGTGFIGGHIVNNLLSKEVEIRVLSRKTMNTTKLTYKGIEYVSGDILEIDSFRKYTKDVDIVYSAFGILGQWSLPERAYWEINTRGVRNLLEGCLDSNIRQFIHISSAGVLGPLVTGVVADETFPFNPSNVYEKTKSEAEKEILKFAERQRLPFTIVRPEFVYGPGDTHVLGLFRAIKNRRFLLLGNGKSLLHPTYIDDLIEGINLCTSNKNAIGKTFLITGERPITVRELAETIAAELGVRLPRIRVPVPVARIVATLLESAAKVGRFEPMLTNSRIRFFTENRAFTYQKAKAELGFLPKMDFREGVRRTTRWYQENGHL
jgi:nucleoside-diphosphate-sugar epimerase